MDWPTLLAAFLGRGIGGVAGGLVSYLQLRSDRRVQIAERLWLDADTVAEINQLLSDLDPVRRGINVNR